MCVMAMQVNKKGNNPSINNSLFLISRAVRKAQENFEHMKDVESIIPCMKNIQNTTSYNLTAKEIEDSDEDVAKAKGKAFIKKYHHFSYVRPGVINCQYIRGKGAYITECIVQLEGTSNSLPLHDYLIDRSFE